MRSSISSLSIISAALITLTSGLPFSQINSESNTSPGSYALPLTRRSTAIDLTASPTDRGRLLLGRLAKAKGKFIPASEDDGLSKRGASAGFVQLGDTPDDTSYYATILLGTPPVAFEVALDTGSSDLIIVTDPCYTGCYSDTQLYRPQDSSTSQVSDESFYIGYVSGSASGLVEADTMSFAGFNIPGQIFGAVNRSDSVVSMGGVSGLLGMAFQPLAATGAMPFVEALWKKNLLAQPLFSFGLARWGKTTEDVVPGGICTIGGTNSTLYSGSINYIPSTSDYWSIPLGNIASGGISLGISYSSVYIDTGTSEIYFPPASAASFYANIPGARDFGGGLYAYHCSATNLGISFTFGGVAYPMNDADFNIGYATEDGVMCYGAIGYIALTAGSAPQYIFGDAFLKNVYSVFRFTPAAVGFATPANPGNVLQSGYVPTGNGTTVQQGGNSTGAISRRPTSVATTIPTTAAAIVTAPLTTATPIATITPTPTPAYVAPSVPVKSVAAVIIAPATVTPVVVPAVVVPTIVAPVVAPKVNIQPVPVQVTTNNGISGLAGLLQNALVSTIASNTLNAVLSITCQPPRIVNKDTEDWTCSS